MTDRPDRRTMDDERYRDLKDDIHAVASAVDRIEELFNDPRLSALGRLLIDRSDTNKQAIETAERRFETFHREEFAPIRDWVQRKRGNWEIFPSLALILGIVGTVLALLAYVGVKAP